MTQHLLSEDDWYLTAVLEHPEGITCGWCGELNDNYDDCGWWYYGKPPTALCKSCFPWHEHHGER